jgi:cobalt-zinc-cadmium resistance protein CzcA
VPVRVKDVGQVVIGGAVRTGSGSRMGSEAVISTVLMLVGDNSRIVATDAAEKLTEINKALPPDVFAEPVYNRSKLVNATIATVEKNLSKARCSSSSCCSCCWATSAPRSSPRR